MNFICGTCNYSTRDKSNFNKHMKSDTHGEKLSKNGNPKLPTKQIFSCGCGKTFAYKSGLSRHKSACDGKNMQHQIDILIDCVNKLTQQNKSLQKQLLEYAKNNKPVVNNNYNLNVKNYVQQNYPNAPALEGIKEYEKLEFENNDLMDTLIYNYNSDILHKCLGNIIVDYYKKDDTSKQSIWTSDVSRLTYVIKELLESNKSIWSHDFKGIKIKLCIINPLLKYIRKCIDDYWVMNLDNMKSMEINKLIEMQEKFIALQKIKKDISDDTLSNNVIRYIALIFI